MQQPLWKRKTPLRAMELNLKSKGAEKKTVPIWHVLGPNYNTE